MKSWNSILGITLSCTFILGPLASKSDAARDRVQIKNKTVVSDKGTLLRGRPLELKAENGWDSYVLSQATWDGMKQRKLNAVRLVLRYDQFSWDKLDKTVDLADKNGFYLIIDNHFTDRGTIENLKDFWTKAAPRYKDRTHVVYEIANEPEYYGSTERNTIKSPAFQETMYSFVRALAPKTHLIMWSWATVPSVDLVNKAPKVDYTNASVGFHNYSGGERLPALRAKYPVIMTEVWLSASCIVGGETNGYSWIPWLRRSGGEKTPAAYYPDYDKFAIEAAKKGATWNSDFGTTNIHRLERGISISTKKLLTLNTTINGRTIVNSESISNSNFLFRKITQVQQP